MTLTVVKGNFPRDVLGAENLTLTRFKKGGKRTGYLNPLNPWRASRVLFAYGVILLVVGISCRRRTLGAKA